MTQRIINLTGSNAADEIRSVYTNYSFPSFSVENSNSSLPFKKLKLASKKEKSCLTKTKLFFEQNSKNFSQEDEWKNVDSLKLIFCDKS